MNVLLDTHALVWWLLEPRHLSGPARKAIEQADEVFVSAASIYEIDYRREKSRASGDPSDSVHFRIPRNMPGSLPQLDLMRVDITAEVAWRVARLPLIHKDPWDRLLVAQANILDARLISRDETLRLYDVDILW